MAEYKYKFDYDDQSDTDLPSMQKYHLLPQDTFGNSFLTELLGTCSETPNTDEVMGCLENPFGAVSAPDPANKEKEAVVDSGAGATSNKAKDATKSGGGKEIGSFGLDKRASDLIASSPTLASGINKFIQNKGRIEYGVPGKGSFYKQSENRIVLDPNNKNPSTVVAILAHEIGHVYYKLDPEVSPAGLTKEEYIKSNVNRDLKNEGEATIMNMIIRDELLKAKKGDIGVVGTNKDKKLKLYKEYKNKLGDPMERDKLRSLLGDLISHGSRPSNDPKVDYFDYYKRSYETKWEKFKSKSTAPPKKKKASAK